MNRIQESKEAKEETMVWPAGRAHQLPRLREFLDSARRPN